MRQGFLKEIPSELRPKDEERNCGVGEGQLFRYRVCSMCKGLEVKEHCVYSVKLQMLLAKLMRMGVRVRNGCREGMG